MYHIAVVEDDKMYAAQLKEYLKRYGEEKKQKISVTMFPDGEDIVTDYSADFEIFKRHVSRRKDKGKGFGSYYYFHNKHASVRHSGLSRGCSGLCP